MAPPIIVVMGVSASGKSTIGKQLADKLDIDFLDADDFHPPENVAKMQNGIPLNDEDRQSWLDEVSVKLSDHAVSGKGVVVACSALKVKYRNILRNTHSEGEVKPVIFVYIEGPIELFAERIAGRKGHFMPPTLLQSQFDVLEVPSQEETVGFGVHPGKIIAINADQKIEDEVAEAYTKITSSCSFPLN